MNRKGRQRVKGRKKLRGKRGTSKESDCSYEGGGESDGASATSSFIGNNNNSNFSNRNNNRNSNRSYIVEPPSYNQPAYHRGGGRKKQAKNRTTNDSNQSSDDDYDNYNDNDEDELDESSHHQANNRFRYQQRLHQHQHQQQQQEEEEYYDHQQQQQEEYHEPPPKAKKGIRRFLSVGRRRKRNKNGSRSDADESLSTSYNSAPVYQQQHQLPSPRNHHRNHDDSDTLTSGYSSSIGTHQHQYQTASRQKPPRQSYLARTHSEFYTGGGIPTDLSFGNHSNDDSDDHYNRANDEFDPSHNPSDNYYGGYPETPNDSCYAVPLSDAGGTPSGNNVRDRRMKGAGVVANVVSGQTRPTLNQCDHLQLSVDSMEGQSFGGDSGFGSSGGGGIDGGYNEYIHDNDNDNDNDNGGYVEYSEDFSLDMAGGHPYSYQHQQHQNQQQREGQQPSPTTRHKKDLASQNLKAIESMARKEGPNPNDEAFQVLPDHSYPNTKMTRRQLRTNMNAPSAYYHDSRLRSRAKKELGQIRVEILQCFGLPTTSLVREVSAYAVAVHGSAAFQTDVIPNVANPMWLSKMRRACLFPVQAMYSQLSIGIFDLEAAYADPSTVMGHPGHPGWVPPDQRGFLGGLHRTSSFVGRASIGSVDRRGSATRVGSSRSMHLESGNRRGSSASMHFATSSVATDEDEDDLPQTHRQPNAFCTMAEDFIGHVTIDICRLRPGSTYDITLPLRRSKHVFSREPQGSVRVRLHLEWNAERSAVMSYLPKSLGGTVRWQKQPSTAHAVNCVDDRAARNVAHAVHGIHMPGKFDMTLLKSTLREINWTRIHILRYCKNREIYRMRYWVYPSISGFVFLAWMHAVYFSTVRYVPGHCIVFLLLHLLKNYAYYAMDSPLQNGFLAPSLEELYSSVLSGTKKRKKPCIEPLTVEREADPMALTVSDHARVRGMGGSESNDMNLFNMDELYDESGNLVHVSRYPLAEIAEAMKKSLKVKPYRKGFTVFKHTFQGDDAVNFLVGNGFAMTRPEAVSLGRRLEREKRLFRHIAKDCLFEDSPYIYCFLDSDTDRYLVQAAHAPAGARLLEWLGFYSRKVRAASKTTTRGSNPKAGGADILESREHVEFPFATGVDHPRFTVKESLVIRSAEEKSRLNREYEARSMAEVAEFGIVPSSRSSFGSVIGNAAHDGHRHSAFNNHVTGYDSESGTRMTGLSKSQRTLLDQNKHHLNSSRSTGSNFVGRAARRGSAVVGSAIATGATVVAAGAHAMTESIRGAGHNKYFQNNGSATSGQHMMEVATGEEMYLKLKEQNNATLDKVLELQRKADEYDPYQYDSDNDVKHIQKKKRKKHVILEKHLNEPVSQEIGNIGTTVVDMSLGKSLEKTKKHINSFFYHVFDEQIYKIDKTVFPIKLETSTENEDKKKKKKRGFFNKRVSIEEVKEEEERQKRMQMTPYEKQKEELNKTLLIHEYSHWNPWINRVAIVMQPLLEMAQTFLFFFRALFNLFTWQDPVLCFWLCFLGPPLALVLYVLPYRVLSAFFGVYWIGPQNYLLRIYNESKENYEPPNFDLIVKKKRIEKAEDLNEMQLFSSESPGNQLIRFKNIDPKQVKQIVVPSNVLMYGNRFYDWPPEPKYARVYASEAPTNLIDPGFTTDENGYETDATFIFDQAARKQAEEEREKVAKKKRKYSRPLKKKISDGLKKTTRGSIGLMESAGGAVVTGTEQVLGATAKGTVGAVKGTVNISKTVARQTGKQAKSAAKGTGNFLRLRKKGTRKIKSKYYADEEYDEYY